MPSAPLLEDILYLPGKLKCIQVLITTCFWTDTSSGSESGAAGWNFLEMPRELLTVTMLPWRTWTMVGDTVVVRADSNNVPLEGLDYGWWYSGSNRHVTLQGGIFILDWHCWVRCGLRWGGSNLDVRGLLPSISRSWWARYNWLQKSKHRIPPFLNNKITIQ